MRRSPINDSPLNRLLLVKVVLALLLLNFLATFVNVWPTAYVRPDPRIGPEFVALWVVLLTVVAAFGGVRRGVITLLTGLFVLVAIGRYVDVTVPAWLGRKLNLYWDAPQLPVFLDVASQSFTWWQILLIVTTFLVGFWLLIRVIRAAIEVLAAHAAPYAVRSPLALGSTLAVVALVVANMTQTFPSRFVAGPVYPVYHRQVDILLTPLIPSRLAKVLPESPPLESDLAVLQGADVKVIFLESYGATTYDNPAIADVVTPARNRLADVAAERGQQVLSAFVRAATFGGASDLSHLSLLSGIDLSDPLRHDLLLATDRKTILDTFEDKGYVTIGLYPSMSWDWPEQSFYDFDRYHDGPSLDYRGPKFGLWWLPDQFSIARINELYPATEDSPPRFLFFPTITTHIPYRPTPPYQSDWSRVTSAVPFSDAETAAALADEIDWDNLFSGYLRSFRYTFDWLVGYLQQPRERDNVLILIGDHQPAGGITGQQANWDVPVHVITSNPLIAEKLRQHRFVDGVQPPRQAIGHISDLTGILLTAFDSGDRMFAATPSKPANGRSGG